MILSVENLCFDYPNNPVLENLYFKCKRGNLMVILGPNGIGKTTILKCINKLLKPKIGTIYISNKNLDKINRKDLAKITGYVEQKREGYKANVFNAVLLGRKPHMDRNVTEDDIRITSMILDYLNLTSLAFENINELSGGELQKVVIARALAQEPELLLMDEPTNHLDIKNQIDVLNIIKNITTKNNISTIITMHDLNLALRYADEFILIKNKQIFALGGEEIITKENIEEVYSLKVDIIEHKNRKVVIPV